METNVKWYLENRIVLAHVVGDNSLEDFRIINEAIRQCFDEGHAPVHLLIDVTELGNIPSNIIKVKQAFTYLDHPSIGWSFFIGEMSAIKKLVVSLTTQMSKLNVKTVNTLEEALAIINRIDSKLSDASISTVYNSERH